MPRYAPKMTEEDLYYLIAKTAIEKDEEEEYTDIDLDNIPEDEIRNMIFTLLQYGNLPKINKDWSKVEFDLENFDIEFIHFTPGGTPVIVACAGGDWEFPVITTIYHDGTNFRGYFPTKGNVYNQKNKTAYGNDEDSDGNELKRLYGVYKFNEMYDVVKHNMKEILQDIDNRIETRGEFVKNHNKKIKSKASLEKEKQLKLEKEKGIDLTNITPDMVYAYYFSTASGCSISFILKVSERTLTHEVKNIKGLPDNFLLKEDSWYGPYSPTTCIRILESLGFETYDKQQNHELRTIFIGW